MKKIMFDDKYDLTKAVLEGRKTMTRRIIKTPRTMEGKDVYGFSVVKYPRNGVPIEVMALDADGAQINNILPKYKVGEVVAVAQAYKDTCWTSPVLRLKDKPGWSNKMFVYAGLMPHQIRITGVRVERLQDISDEDCIREGIEEDSPYYWVPVNMSLPNWRKIVEGVSDMYPNDRDGKVYPHFWDSPRKAFAALIDRLSGKGTWKSNPWVFVYEFELVK